MAGAVKDGSTVVTTTCWPAFRPVTIWDRESPLSPTTTGVETVLPFVRSSTYSAAAAGDGVVRQRHALRLVGTTAAEALIPGLTLELC